ncbi:hypothetical protein ScPMuIL_001432 [Solemya velum]
MAASEADHVQCFSTYEEADEFIRKYEVETTSQYVKRNTLNFGKHSITTLDKRRIWFEDHRGEIKIFDNGIPFVSIGKEIRECHHGPKRERKSAKKC